MITAILLAAFLNHERITWNIYEEGHGETNAVCQYMPDTKKVICYNNINLADYEGVEVFQPQLLQYELESI
jgi:hypothetical protein